MQLQCNLCNSTDIEVVFHPHLKNKVKVEKADFTPTTLDFGIFYDLARCRSYRILLYLSQAAELGDMAVTARKI
jgi:hypothetical protein